MQTKRDVMPEDWTETTLGTVSKVKSGATPNTQTADLWNGTIPWCTPTDVTNTQGKYLSSTERCITEAGLVSCAASLLPRGSLLLCSRATIGEVKIAATEICTNQGFKSLVCLPKNSNEFLYYLLLTLKPLLLARAVGSTFTEVGKRDLESIVVQMPNEDEQIAIAEVLSDVDGLLEALEALIAKKRNINQATMQQLLTGKTRLPGFCEEWVKTSLGNLATVTMGQSPPSVSYNFRGNGVPLLQGNADIKNRKSLDRVWTTQPSKLCDSDDLLLTVRAPVGIVASAKNPACLGRGICGLKPTINSSFLFYALVFAESRWQVDEQGSTFTAVNRKQVEKFRLRIPADENEQTAIATVLSDMDTEIAVQERRRDKIRAIKKGMMQQLLTGRIRLVKSK